MERVWIKKDAWNKLIQEIKDLKDFAESKEIYRLFFRGHEVYNIIWESAKEDHNEWLSIWIYGIGEIPSDHMFQKDRGIEPKCIACFDKWYMTEEMIRKELQNLEVRRVDVIKRI